MAAAITLTDGTTTIDLMDAANGYQVLDSQWSPRVAARNDSGLGGKPYLPVTETMQIKVTGSTPTQVNQRLHALAQMLDKAGRWYIGENVDAVLLTYTPSGSASVYSTPVYGLAPGDALLGLPSNFASSEIYTGKDGVTLLDVSVMFVRDGLWYGDEEDAYTNLVTNGDFETNTTPWGASNATLSRSTAIAYTGSASLLATATGVGGIAVNLTGANRVPVVAGNDYVLQANCYFNNAVTSRLYIIWYDAGGSIVLQVPGSFFAADNTWVMFELAATAPAGATTARIDIINTGTTVPSAGALFYADNVRFYATGSGSTTSSGNPCILELSFTDSAAVPSPIGFNIDQIALHRRHNVFLAISNSTDMIKLLEAEDMTGSGGADTAVSGASGGNVYKLSSAGYVRSDTTPAAKRIAAIVTVRNLSSTVTWDISLAVSESDGMASTEGTQSAIITVPVSSEPDIYLLGPVSLAEISQAAAIIATPSDTVSGGDELEIDSVMLVGLDGNTQIVTLAEILNYTAQGFGSIPNEFADFTFDPAPLTRPSAEVYAEIDTGVTIYRKHLPALGNRAVYLRGDKLVIGYVGQAVGDAYTFTTDSYVAQLGGLTLPSTYTEAEANITLSAVTRRKAYLIPE